MRKVDREITSISELIKFLLEDTDGLGMSVWYRGLSIKEYKLLPLAIRETCDTELNLIKRFKQNASLLVEPRPSKSYEWLFIMRHHGVPTRLLDWSESPLVAAYFAVKSHANCDGVLWMLLPLEMNNAGERVWDDPHQLPSFEEDDFMDAYSPEAHTRDKHTQMLPIAFIAPRNTPRMQSQLSVFTIHHRHHIAVDEIEPKTHVWRYIIPKQCKDKMKKELALLGISKFQLFPELQSLGEIMREG